MLSYIQFNPLEHGIYKFLRDNKQNIQIDGEIQVHTQICTPYTIVYLKFTCL